MKLAFCLHRYFPFGGLQRDFLRIAKECVRRGHTVDIFAMKWEDKKDLDFNIHIIPTSKWQNHSQAKQFFKKIQPLIKEYDVAIGFNKMPGLDIYYAADTCYQAKTKKTASLFYRLTPRYRHLINYETAVFSKDSPTHILSLSALQQTDFISYYQTPSERFHLLPPGITENRKAPKNAEQLRLQTRDTFNIKENEFLLLMIGSGFKTKGLDRALNGIASLPHTIKNRCHFFIIGKDNPTSFQKQAKKLGITNRIQFLGGREDIPSFLLAADLLLHPAYNENTGTVLLEATISGLPVLTTDVCGYAHYIEKAQSGIVLPSPFQQKQFNIALENMLLSPEQTVWKKNGLAFAKQADIYRLPEKAVDIIELLANQKVNCEFTITS